MPAATGVKADTASKPNGIGNGNGHAALRLGKSARRRAKQKAQQQPATAQPDLDDPTQPGRARKQQLALSSAPAATASATTTTTTTDDAPVQVEPEPLPETNGSMDSATREYFARVLGHFAPTTEEQAAEVEKDKPPEDTGKGDVIYSEDEEYPPGWDEEAERPLSKRKQRKLNRLTVGELKQRVARPEVVEGWDVDSADPRLLVHLKSYHNTIAVPEHWKFKRDYLSNKRGMEKPPFQLPPYIAATGIVEMKDSLKEQNEGKTLKAQTRERVQPKMGKVEVDYQALHDAFFKFQTPPKLSGFGDIYYEGKEYETQRNRDARPGRLSSQLKEALNMPPGAPPPWLYAMQRIGPPPSYPYLRIPGLNAPLPPGATWGVQPGEWGYPPADAYGRPIYPDVNNAAAPPVGSEDGVTAEGREHWGELPPEEEAEESEEEEDDEGAEEDEEPVAEGEASASEELEDAGDAAQYYTGDGLQSTLPGTESGIQLRKGGRPVPGIPEPPPAPTGPRQLYTVIQEQEVAPQGFLGTGRQYDLASATTAGPVLGQERAGSKRQRDDVVVSGDAVEGASQTELASAYAQQHPGAAAVPTAPGADAEQMQILRQDLARKRHESDARRRTRRD